MEYAHGEFINKDTRLQQREDICISVICTASAQFQHLNMYYANMSIFNYTKVSSYIAVVPYIQ